MILFDRRRFVAASTAAVLTLRPRLSLSQVSSASVTLRPDQAGPTVPANFIGLSYEIEQLSDPAFFSATNTSLIAQFRALSPRGVLRLGGNTSDVGWWKPSPASPKPPMSVRKVVGEPSADLSYAIEPQAITKLRGFLDASGWTCIFGINLATNTPALAADEAVFVTKALGPKLEYFQLGNEPDLFRNHMRDPATWNADRYFDEWLAAANAIQAKVPDARFGLPDTAGNPDWYATVVSRLLALRERTCPCDLSPAAACSCAVGPNAPALRPRIAALSHHYYFGGPPANPEVNINRLLQPSPQVNTLAHDIQAAAAQLHVPYRMTEGNTCYRGGKPGVSDVFAASLWAADYALKLASSGYAGINLHGGGGKQVANSLGGTLPGEDLMPDRNAPHPRPFYTPIADINGKYTAEPTYYGLLFAGHFAGATMMPLAFNSGPVNATAYAATLPTGQQAVAIINKDESKPLSLNLPGFALNLVLSAPSLTSTRVDLTELASFREASTVPPATAYLLYNTRS